MYTNEFYRKNKTRLLEAQERWRKKNRAWVNERQRGYYKNSTPAKKSAHYKNSTPPKKGAHWKRFGLTKKKYNEIYRQQEGKCAICGIKMGSLFKTTKSKEILHADHCHKKNKHRGLLCRRCNQGLGFFKDNTKILLNAINYINLFP